MFISFTLENAYSFYDAQTLSARAVKTCKERQDDATIAFPSNCKARLVKTLAIYGANASGKSNIFLGLADMQRLILFSASEAQAGVVPFTMPFLLSNDANEKRPTRYAIEFTIEDIQYKYAFAILDKSISEEYLVRKNTPNGKYHEVFSRALIDGENKIHCDKSFPADELIRAKTRRNALFLSTCAMLAVPEAEKILEFFSARLKVVPADRMSARNTLKALGEGRYKDAIVKFLKVTDPGIADVTVAPSQNEPGRILPDGTREMYTTYEPLIAPILKDGSTAARTLPLMEIASMGTIKAFNLAAYIFEALENGAALMLDELDSRLHPLLTKEIIRLFNSAETNPRGAQLIFNTHDTNLLSAKIYDKTLKKRVYLLRRDEIYFVEKNGQMCSKIYSLSDFKKEGRSIRNDASHEKDYLAGLYGAVPYI